MNTTSHLVLHSIQALGLVVVLPLVWVVLAGAERRRVAAGRHGLGHRSLRGFFALVLGATILGVVATFGALIVQTGEPLQSPLFVAGLACLGVAVLLAAVAVWRGGQSRAWLVYSSGSLIASISEGKPSAARWLVPLLRLSAVGLVLGALLRPQMATTEADVFTEGMDIVLTMDVSTSMRAVDFAPPSRPRDRKSRIEGEKEVIRRFVEQRKNDRIGVVVFSREAFTQCPVTLDYSVVLGIIQSLQTGVIEDGTAIGDAIAVSINRLRDSDVKSKVIILLTDGDDNASKLAPLQAAEIAASEKIRIYPILIGKGGKVPYPFQGAFGQVHYQAVEMPTNPELLKQIAEIAKGKYYRAEDEEALAEDLQDTLNHLEKSRLMDPGRFTRSTEKYQMLLWPALIVLMLELLLGWTRFRKFP